MYPTLACSGNNSSFTVYRNGLFHECTFGNVAFVYTALERQIPLLENIILMILYSVV